jgi:hypothetical protein
MIPEKSKSSDRQRLSAPQILALAAGIALAILALALMAELPRPGDRAPGRDAPLRIEPAPPAPPAPLRLPLPTLSTAS